VFGVGSKREPPGLASVNELARKERREETLLVKRTYSQTKQKRNAVPDNGSGKQ